MKTNLSVTGPGTKAEAAVQRVLGTLGVTQSDMKIITDSRRYWSDTGNRTWKGDAHWCDAPIFQGNDLWIQIGRSHRRLLEQGARMLGSTAGSGRVIEWGCGGGANAVAFAPQAREFIGVDISSQSLRECGRQVAAVCDTPYRPILIDAADPEAVLAEVTDPCDVFLSFYVFELLPSPAYGERILRLAHRLLAPGGLALIQIKYDTGSWRTKPRGRSYRSGPAGMTTYSIPAFWQLAEGCGLRPESVHLVPQDELDERYAYFLLVNSGETDTTTH